jgi:hypothetical protein
MWKILTTVFDDKILNNFGLFCCICDSFRTEKGVELC